MLDRQSPPEFFLKRFREISNFPETFLKIVKVFPVFFGFSASDPLPPAFPEMF
jgi:hypothetical protein